MKITYRWLREFIDFEWTVKELSDKLTFSGIEVEAVEPLPDGDFMLDLEITPNRPDCLSLLGIARDVRALSGGRLIPPDCGVSEAGPAISGLASLTVEDGRGCPRYLARVITGVRVAESPGWLKQKIEKIGLRPVNNVADVTNLVMYELGHPLHAFDYDKLEGQAIVVRRAKPGEDLTTLDGVQRKLSAEHLVIADARRPVALAGIMGGLDSEISGGTQNVLLESAYFDPDRVRLGSRALGLKTDASYRFERGADPLVLRKAADRAARLISELAGGQVASGVLNVAQTEFPEFRPLSLRPERANGLLGTAIPAQRMAEILNGLELKAEVVGSEIRVMVPSFRRDLEREVDLIEEVGRIYGYDNLPDDGLAPWAVPAIKRSKDLFLSGIGRALAGLGFCEHYGLTLTDPARLGELDLSPVLPSLPAVELVNPLSSDLAALRPSLLPGLLEAARRNLNNGIASVRLFEVGKVFQPGPDVPRESLRLAVLAAGPIQPQGWDAPARQADFFDIKGVAGFIAEWAGTGPCEFSPAACRALHPGRSASLIIGGRAVGCCGELAPGRAQSWGIRERVYYLELDLEGLIQGWDRHGRRYRELPRFPAVRRDLALELAEQVECREVMELIRRLAGPDLEEVKLFDLYQGKQIEKGKKSMAFALVYRAANRTLTDTEVAEIHRRVVDGLKDKLQAGIR